MKVEQIITDKIIEYLKKGEIPWRKPWIMAMPQNYISKREYSGINVFLLSMLEYKQPYFLTFNQATDLGVKIKKGEHGNPVIYWGVFEPDKKDKEDDDEFTGVPFMRYYNVFNVEQCEGLKVPEPFNNKEKPDCEEVFRTYKDGPKVSIGGNRASYDPKEDKVSIPSLGQFRDASGYYSAIYHELVHSTGLKSRLARFNTEEMGIFGSESYSKEELIAELGAAFLCAKYKLDNSQLVNSAGYIQGWLKPLQNDPKFVISASSKAQKGVNYILGKITP